MRKNSIRLGYLVSYLSMAMLQSCQLPGSTTGSSTDTSTSTATSVTYQVTPFGSNVSISPGGAQVVSSGGTLSFTVSANAGFAISGGVSGTCPAGAWNGSAYQTGKIVGNCSVVFSATAVLPPVPTAALSVNPSSISAGASSTLSWSSANASSCVGTGFSSASAVSGSVSVSPASTTTYSISCTGAAGTATSSATLTVNPLVYTVTPSGSNVALNPNAPQSVASGGKQAFTVTANAGYSLSSTVGGTCSAGSWSGSVYTTGVITANCTVSFSASAIVYTVTPSGLNLAISPSTPQSVASGAQQAFTITANAGYSLSSAVGGTCSAGNWSGSVYTTGAIVANCTVSFSASPIVYSVTPLGSNVGINPGFIQSVFQGGKQAFTVTANAGYTLSSSVGGSCPAGNWSGSVYTTGAIVATCTVSFSASAILYTVTSSGSNVAISPSTSQSVASGAQQSFTVTANEGYALSSSVGGSCPAGSWIGSVYTTGVITASCAVSFSATANVYTVSPSGLNLAINPSTPQSVASGSKQTFTVTANAGYSLSSAVGGNCPAGSFNGNVYTTGAVAANCSVSFSGSKVSSALAPIVFNYQQSAKPGDDIYFQGANLAGAQVNLVGYGILPQLTGYGSTNISVRLPSTVSGALVVYLSNANGNSPSYYLNQAYPYHIDATRIAPGGAFRLIGKNLLLPGSTPSVNFNGQAAALNLAASTETMLVGTAPSGLSAGPLTITADNGNGSGPATIVQPTSAASATGLQVINTGSTADPFGLNVGWASSFAGIARVVIDPTTNANVNPHMVAGNAADNTSALQSAVNYASSIGGGIVKIPAGTYLIAGSVTLRSGVVIQGAGKAATILNYTGWWPITAQNQDLLGVADLTLSTSTSSPYNRFVVNAPFMPNNTRLFLKNISHHQGPSSYAGWFTLTKNVDLAIVGSDFITEALGSLGMPQIDWSTGVAITGSTFSYAGNVALNASHVADMYFGKNTVTMDMAQMKALWVSQGSPLATPTLNGNHLIFHAFAVSGRQFTIDSNSLSVVNGPLYATMGWNCGEGIYSEPGDTDQSSFVGMATSATANTLTDANTTLTFGDVYNYNLGPSGFNIAIIAGTGYGQMRHITGYSGRTVSVDQPWDQIPDATSKYLVTIPNWENVVFKNNYHTGWRGTWLYISTVNHVDFLNNTYSESGGIWIRPQSDVARQNPANLPGQLDTDLLLNVNIIGNSVTNTKGYWASYISSVASTLDYRPAGLALAGLTVKGNSVVANATNVNYPQEDIGGAQEGYTSFMVWNTSVGYSLEPNPVQLGTISQGNSCTNCSFPFRTGQGVAAAVFDDTTLVNSGPNLVNSVWWVPPGQSGPLNSYVH